MAATIGGRLLGSCREPRIGEQATDRHPRPQQSLEAPEALPAQFEQMENEDIPRLAQGVPRIEQFGPWLRRRGRGCVSLVVGGATEQGRGE